MSRPTLSVPNQCCADGGCSTANGCVAVPASPGNGASSGEQGHDDDAGGRDRPHDQEWVRPQPATQGRAAGDLGDLGRKRCGRLDHRSLILGSMPAWTMSTIRFATTYARATNNVTPRMAGVSRVEIDAAA